MRPLPPIEQVLPVFHNTFDHLLTRMAKVSFISALALPIVGGAFAAPLLITTRFGNNREAEKSTLVIYGLAPLATIGVGACLMGLSAIGTLAASIILDLTHHLIFGRHAMNYRAVFFPFKFNFIDCNALIR